MGWLSGDHAIRMGVGLVVGVWMARYLGPEQFGLLNYAMAFVSLFGVIASLGLNGIVVRDLVKNPESANDTLGSAFLLQIIGGLLALVLAILAINFARPDDNLAKLMVSILGFVMVFKATEVVKYWFESLVQSKYSVWVENSVFLIFAGVKISLILTKAPLMSFVWAMFAEGLLVAIGLLGICAWQGGWLLAWHGHYKRARRLLKDSWPLILSGLATMVYMRIDQIMLGQMLGDEAVGIYSAAVRISEIWYFIPMAIAASAFPAIIEARKLSEALFYQRLQKLYDLMVMLAFAVAIPMTLLSEWVVTSLFGKGYANAAPVLSISIWAGVSVAMSAVHSKWLLIEGMQKYGLVYTSTGAAVNVVLNLFLIPSYGVVGAAWATLTAQIVPIFIQVFLPKARINFRLMVYATWAPYRYMFNKTNRGLGS